MLIEEVEESNSQFDDGKDEDSSFRSSTHSFDE